MASKYPSGWGGYPVAWWTDPSQQVISDEQMARLLDWVRSLGLDPNRCLPVAAVIEYDGRFELHVDEHMLDAGGRIRRDPLYRDEVLKQRRIIPVTEGNWPEQYELKPIEELMRSAV